MFAAQEISHILDSGLAECMCFVPKCAGRTEALQADGELLAVDDVALAEAELLVQELQR